MATTNEFDITEGKLKLHQEDDNLAALHVLFNIILEEEVIELTNVRRTSLNGSGIVQISGEAPIWGGQPSTISLQHDKEFNLLQFKISKQLGEFSAIESGDVFSFNQLRDELELQFSNGAAPATGTFNRSVSAIIQIQEARVNFPVRIVKQGNDYTIASKFEANNAPNLSKVAGLFGGADALTDAFDWLPEAVRDLLNAQVDSFSFTINPEDARKLTNINARLAFAPGKSWVIIPGFDFLKVGDLWARLEVEHPLEAEYRFPTVQIGGAIFIGGARIALTARWPDLEIRGSLMEGNAIPVPELFEAMGLPTSSLPGDKPLLISSLHFAADPSGDDKSFSFLGTISNVWKLKLFGDATFEIEELSLFVSYDKSRTKRTSGSFSGKLAIGGIDISLLATSNEAEPGFTFSGAAAEGTSIEMGKLIQKLGEKFGGFDHPEVLASQTLSNIKVSFNTYSKDFHFSCQTSIDIEDEKADLLLNIDIILQADETYKKSFSGLLSIGPRQFEVSFDLERKSTTLTGTFTNEEGEKINLVKDLLGLVSEDADLSLFSGDSDEFNLTLLELYFLQLQYKKTGTTNSYSFSGNFAWKPVIPLGMGEPLELSVQASVEDLKIIQKGSGGTQKKQVSGTISGIVDSEIPYFESLTLETRYEFGMAATQLFLGVRIGPVTFESLYEKKGGDIHLEFRAKPDEDLNLGSIITFVVSMVDPTIDEFEFDPPWNFLNDFTIDKSLVERISLTMDFRQSGTKSLGVKLGNLSSLVPDSLDKIMTINSLELKYESKDKASGTSQNRKKKKDKKVKIILDLDAKFLNTDKVSWDPLNDAPPEVPGQGAAIFDLRYLGLGQHIAFTQAGQVESIGEVMGLLRGVIDQASLQTADDRSLKNRNPLELFGDGGPIAFSAESDWLIGLDISLLKTLNLSVIFNDPLIYGLRIELYGEMAKNFAGLKFEILYRRGKNNIGVYHIDLTLPDFVRYLQFGAVSVTLPVLVLDIFTNGDFKVDLGFPWNLNFSRSFAIEVLPFTGAGGFYFNKLSAATATSTPRISEEVGVFTPVYEFGLGLRIGVGKSFNKGPLKAEISITVQGVIEGVISWYNPRQAGERELYYAIRGAVALVGRLYGAVDFKVIKIEVEVVARAMIQFVVEVYKPIYIKLTAEVSVSATITILFVEVEFSFGLTLELSFEIETGDEGQEPWKQGIRSIAMAGTAAMFTAARSITQVRSREEFDWSRKDLKDADEKHPLDLYFQPALTWTNGGVKGEALLFIENARGSTDNNLRDFDVLLRALLRWTWVASGENESTLVRLQEIDELYEEFMSSDNASFTYEHLEAFLNEHFVFRLWSWVKYEMNSSKLDIPNSVKTKLDGLSTKAFPSATALEKAVKGVLQEEEFKDHWSKILENATPAGSIQGTIFPMLPSLEMKLGEEPTSIDFDRDAYQLDNTQLERLSNFFSQSKAQVTGVASEELSSAASNKISTAKFIFADYARLLIRSGLQAARDRLESDPSGRTFDDLMDELARDNAFGDAAAIASRFLLYGLRFPEIGKTTGSLTAQGLYEATAQQFDLTKAKLKDKKEYQISLIPRNDDPSIELPETGDTQLTYVLNEATDTRNSNLLPLFKLAEELGAITENKIGSTSIDFAFFAGRTPEGKTNKPALIPFYKPETVNFALRNWIDGTNFTILPFSSSMEVYLKEKAQNPALTLFRESNSSTSPALAADDAIPAEKVFWSTRIDFTIRSIPSTSEEEKLQDTYLMAGTDENGQNRLEAVWKHINNDEIDNKEKEIELSLLYGRPGTAGEHPVAAPFPGDQNGILIIKSNLATERGSDNDTTVSAAFNNEKDFLKLIWEGSNLSSGGYYLHIPHGDPDLNDSLFKGSEDRTLILLIRFTNPADIVYDFHNCVYVGKLDSPLNLEEELIIARSSETTPILSIPPGHIGFSLEREKVTARSRTTSTEQQLRNFYQLLGYQAKRLDVTREGIPIGPTGKDHWLYERVLPTFLLMKKSETGSSEILPPDHNPYLGINASAQIELECWWQDLYGNQLLSAKETVHFDHRYTDPIIGINQWPSVVESYEFEKEADDKIVLNIEFVFEPAPFVNALIEYRKAGVNASEGQRKHLMEKLSSALAVLKTAYYQIGQQDVEISIDNSVVGNLSISEKSEHQFNKKDLQVFIRRVYDFLGDLYGLLDKPDEKLPIAEALYYKVSFDSNRQLRNPDTFIFPVTVHIDIKRRLEWIHASLKEENRIKAEHKSVLQDRSYLSPKITALKSEEVQETTDLQDLLDTSAEALIAVNLKTPGIIRPQELITIEDLENPIITLSTDTFEKIRKRILESLQENFPDEPVSFTLSDLATVLRQHKNLIAEGARLKLPPDSSSLRGFATKFQEAFPGLRLAVSKENQKNNQNQDRNELPVQPLWAVHLGQQGITYDIEEQVPAFFAIPPLANTLLSGKVPVDHYQEGVITNQAEKQFDSIDLNVLARDFLVTLESFFQPENLVSAYKLDNDMVENVLKEKANLAASISEKIEPVLLKDTDKEDQLKEAKIELRRQLLTDLVEGYDIETIVQYKVTIQKGALIKPGWKIGLEPRVAGKASVVHARLGGDEIDPQELDFTLSAGKIALKTEETSSYLTYFFDTKTPERFSEIELELLFESAEMEHQVEVLEGIADFEDSSWLSFILPQDLKRYKLTTDTLTRLETEKRPDGKGGFQLVIPTSVKKKLQNLKDEEYDTQKAFLGAVAKVLNEEQFRQHQKDILLYAQLHASNPNYMGRQPVPIPLRSYPMPPGLVIQRAQPDPDSLDNLADVRQWRYTIVYEHPDIAQDTIECVVELNSEPPPSPIAVKSRGAVNRNLFEALVNFKEIYPVLSEHMALVRKKKPTADEKTAAKKAVETYRKLVQEIAAAWKSWNPVVTTHSIVTGDLHYEIREEKAGKEKNVFITSYHKPIANGPEPAPEPTVALPGYKHGFEIALSKLPDSVPGEVKQKLAVLENDTFVSKSALRRIVKTILTDWEFENHWTALLDNASTVTHNDHGDVRKFSFEESEGDLTFFGDSSIPDRMLSIENLDVIYHQNAWAYIWLSRNKELIPKFDTNPAFIFQTPSVRFNNLVIPFLVNEERWNIALLGSDGGLPVKRNLVGHLTHLFSILLPQKEKPEAEGGYPDFEIRLDCRYAFAFAKGKNLSYDLLSSFPMLVSLRLANPYLAGKEDGDSFTGYIDDLANKILDWYHTNKPVEEQAAFIFSASYFSKIEKESLSSLPMLKIEHLALQLVHVSDLK